MKPFSAVDAVSVGWQLTKKYFIISLGLVLAYAILAVLLNLGSIVMQLIGWGVSIIFSMGMIRIALNAVDGQEPYFAAFKEVLSRFGSFLLMTVVILVVIYVPVVIIMLILIFASDVDWVTVTSDPSALASIWWIVLICMIPVIYLGIRFFFAQYLLIDKNMGAIESLKTSWKATAPHQGQIFLFLILSLALSAVGFIVLFVGVFVSAIILFYAGAALYRQVFPGGEQDALIVEESAMVEMTNPE